VRVVKLKELADKLNVSPDIVLQTIQKLLDENEITGVIDRLIHWDRSFIHYTSEDVDNLLELLDSNCISIDELAKRLDLRTHQVRLIIDKLQKENRIKGLISSDDMFISDKVIDTLKAHLSEKNEVNINNLSNKLGIPKMTLILLIRTLLSENRVKGILQEDIFISETLIENKKKDYERTIERLTLLFSKGEINEESYKVSIQSLEKELGKFEEIKKMETGIGGRQMRMEREINIGKVSKPSSAWYLVPLFLGLIGGLIGYLVVKDQDKDMAEAILWLGFGLTIISIIALALIIPEFFILR